MAGVWAARTRAAAVLVGLILVLAANAGGHRASADVGEIVVRPEPDILVSQDPDPIVARNSPSLVVNPVQPTNMVVVDRVDRPDYTAGVHVSNNGGGNWQDIALKRPAGNSGKLFAPSATFDSDGTLFVSFVILSGTGNDPDSFWVTRSGDGGLSFDEPSRIAGADTYQTTLAADPEGRRLFAAWLQATPEATTCLLCFAQTGLPIVVSWSDDGGRTWSPPAPVSDAGRMRIGAPALAVDPDGNPAVLYVDYGADRFDWENLPGGIYDGTFSIVLARSADRGGRWEPGRVVDADMVPTGRFLVYLPVSPGFAIARNGDMLAAWADARSGDADILLRRSTDDGRTWSRPVPVNRGRVGDGVPQDMPAVSVAPGGRVDVIYYDRSLDRQGSNVDVLLSSSSDGGETFPKTFRLNKAASNRRVGPQGTPYSSEADFGSRISVASLSGGAVAAWTDTRNGSPDTDKQDIFSASVPLDDNTSVGLAFRLLAGSGILLGIAGVTLFVLSRRARKQSPPAVPSEEPAAVP